MIINAFHDLIPVCVTYLIIIFRIFQYCWDHQYRAMDCFQSLDVNKTGVLSVQDIYNGLNRMDIVSDAADEWDRVVNVNSSSRLPPVALELASMIGLIYKYIKTQLIVICFN